MAKLKRRTYEAEQLLAFAALVSEEKGYCGAWEKAAAGDDSLCSRWRDQ